MQCTARRLAPPGFFKRSLTEFSRLSKFALSLEGVTGPQKPLTLIHFDQPDSIEMCKSMSDEDLGGFSSSNLDFQPATATEPAHARFHGKISTQLPSNRPDVVKTGFSGWRTHDRGATIFGRALWDIDPYKYLALRVKSDGRKYFINIQTDSLIVTDLHQHRLYVREPGVWETVFINFRHFVRTNGGQRIEPQSDMLRQQVKSVGISLIDRRPEPFDLQIAGMWATNWLSSPDADPSTVQATDVTTAEPLRREQGIMRQPKRQEKEELMI